MANRQPTPDILSDVLSGKAPAPTQIAVSSIRTDGGTQMRAEINWATVAEYKDALLAGAILPPPVLYFDGDNYWVGDGFHRMAAWKQAYQMPGMPNEYTRDTIPCEVRSGTRRDAVLHAAGANASHGLRRTNADKRRAVETMLRDEEWAQWSNSEIARRCVVGESTVRNIRAELESASQIAKVNERKGADGKTYNTANIGSRSTSEVEKPTLYQMIDLVKEVPHLHEADLRRAIRLHANYWLYTKLAQKAEERWPGAWSQTKLVQAMQSVLDKMTHPAAPHSTASQEDHEYESSVPMLNVVPSQDPGSRQQGAELAKCSACNRPLSDPASAIAGIGPCCAAKRSAAAASAAVDDDDDGFDRTQEEIDSAAALLAETGLEFDQADDRLIVIPPKIRTGPMAVHFSSETPEHYTPQVIIEAAVDCMGAIDLDPCSNSKESPNVPAAAHYTREDNGLAQPWHRRVYMNPPYGREIDEWIAKLVSEYEAGNVTEAIALVPSRTDTQWWQRLRNYHVCLVTGRLKFIGNNDPAPFPSAVFYLGQNIGRFVYAFEELGDIWHRTIRGIDYGD